MLAKCLGWGVTLESKHKWVVKSQQTLSPRETEGHCFHHFLIQMSLFYFISFYFTSFLRECVHVGGGRG